MCTQKICRYININSLGQRILPTMDSFFNSWNQSKFCSNHPLGITARCILYHYPINYHAELVHVYHRHNIVMIERDYYTHFKGEQLEGKSKGCSCNYADIIVDQSVGLVLRPMSLLSTDAGLKTVISTTTALSFQFEAIWVLLYTGDRQQ